MRVRHVPAGAASFAGGTQSHSLVLPVGPGQAAHSTGGPAAPLLPGMRSPFLWLHCQSSEQQLCISQGCMSAAAVSNVYTVTAAMHPF